MKNEFIMSAEFEATRFLDAVKVFKNARQKIACSDYIHESSPIESGTLKRASLDLTRALAKMRKV